MTSATTPQSSYTKKIHHQVLAVGGKASLIEELPAYLDHREAPITHIKASKWMDTDWQNSREAGVAWALVDLDAEKEYPFEEHLRCVQAVSLAYRPTRLIVVRRHLAMDKMLFLMKAGADGMVDEDVSAKRLVEEFKAPGLNVEELFPSPIKWLNSLVRAAEELGLSENPTHQTKKLLRLFASELNVARASLALLEEDQLRIAACVGMPEAVKEGDSMELRPNSITAWVIENRRARLIEGEYVRRGTDIPKSEVRSAVCAPLIARGQLYGVVSFSSLDGGRMLNGADLATAEVFANLLALTISNHELHEEMLHQERLATVGATVSSVSHCVKNLLTVLNGSMSIMGMALDRQDLSQAAMSYRLLQKGAGRMESLVMDLLDFSKERQPDLEPTDVEKIFQAIVENFSVLSLHTSHSLGTTNSIEKPMLLDEYRLQRALMNLVSNAIDATPKGGLVHVSAKEVKNQIHFIIEDDGPGVTEEKLESIFRPFYSTKGSKGTGLGLAMVAKFVEECGGEIEAGRSRQLGGFQVIIKLPLRVAE